MAQMEKKTLDRPDEVRAFDRGIRVRMDDGSEDEFGPGDVSLLPPGHDAWVVGDEPAVVIDISGMANYAKAA